MEEIIALNKLITEFCETNSRFLSAFDRILGQHVIHRNVLAHLPDEIQKSKILEPIIVIDKLRSLRTIKVQKLHQLFFLPFEVFLKALCIEQRALGRLERGVSHHACRSSN